MKIYTYPDITGTGALQALKTVLGIVSQPCKLLQFTIVSNASGNTIRLGDAAIGATQGIPLGGSTPGSTSQFIPQISEDLRNYDVADWYVIIPSGDVLSVAYGV